MTENPKLTLRYLSLAINCRLRLYLVHAPWLFLLAPATSFSNGSSAFLQEIVLKQRIAAILETTTAMSTIRH